MTEEDSIGKEFQGTLVGDWNKINRERGKAVQECVIELVPALGH